MLRDYLKDYGLSSDQINYICKYYGSEDSLLDSEDFEIAAISGLSIEEARRLKEFIATKRHGGVARDFLRRWSRILSDEDLESAYREYEKLAKLHPESPVIWQIKGELLEKMGRHAEAMEAYRRAKELYEKRNEIPPSVLEEKLHGATYHHRTQTNGIGLINGLGFSNGKSRSHVNGFSNGFKNGIINGSGLVNGTGRIGGERRGQTPPIIRFLIAMVIIFVVVYSPLISLFFFQGAPAYSIDGNFDEWRSAVPYYSLKSAPGDIDITVVKFHPTERGLYFFIQSRSRIFQNASGYYIFIDGDMDSNTGYLVDNIGAEYMVEIYGWNGSIVGRSLYLFNSTDNYDFSGFTNIGDVAAASRGNMLEGFIPHRFYNFRSVVVSSDYAGGSDVVDVPKYGSTPIYIREKSYSTIVHFNETEPVLKLEFFSQTNFTLDNITFKFNGTATPVDMNRIALYLDDGDNVFDSHDTMISDSWGLKDGWKIIFPKLDLNLKNKSTIFLTVRCQWNYLMERSIFVSVVNLGVNLDYVIVDLSDGGSYIGRIPDEVHVDGSFMDWQHTKSDPVMDVRDPAGHYTMGDYNIDITNYSSYNGDHLYFYLAVNGELFGGSACPVERSYRLPDSDGDSVPDRFDIYPYDFNNDGVPDDESVIIINGTRYPDVDGDGIPDYPYGEDMWLNTTIPSNFPAPYGGKEVHKYIGPVPTTHIYGYDTLRIYINSDNNVSTGFSLPHFPIGADYMVEMYGTGGSIINASLYTYSAGNWTYLRNISFFKGYHSIELDSGISTLHASSVMILSDWDSDRDLTDSPLVSPDTRGVNVHKQLHLHYNATSQNLEMDTFKGNTGYYVNIKANNYALWVMTPSFAKDFEISSYPVVSLYLVPHPVRFGIFVIIPGLNVSLYVYNFTTEEATLIGYDYNPDISDSGWYNFTVKNTTSIAKGETLVLRVLSTGYSGVLGTTSVDVYFNSTDYDSKIDIPTSTYISVDYLRTYNSSEETDVFDGGEYLIVRAKISDPFGYRDVSAANIFINGPDGLILATNNSMDYESHTTSAKIFYYSLTVPDVPGEYNITVVGYESNGVTSSGVGIFFVRARMAVAIYPDTTLTSSPGKEAWFNISLLNLGNMIDTYVITADESTEHFPFDIYMGSIHLATDSDGDGEWNWVNSSYDVNGSLAITVQPLERINLTIIKHVPYGTWGKSDLLILNASSISNSTVYDDVRLRTNVEVLSLKKALYLNGSSSLSLKHGNSERSVTINYGQSHSWSFSRIYYDINLTGYIVANLYVDAKPSSYSGVAMTVSIYADSTLIGKDEIIGERGARWYQFTIVPRIDTIPKNSEITVKMEVKGYLTSAVVYYDSDAHPSNITIPTSDHIEIRSLYLYNASGKSQTFHAGERVRVVASITSPFGSEDISTAYLNITDPMDSKVLSSTPMTLETSSNGMKVYIYNYDIPEDGLSGYWHVRVDVHDDPILRINATTFFFIPWNVSVDPDHNITTNRSSMDRYFLFNHTITNTGWGANIFEISSISSDGFDIQLIIDGNLAAEDYDGDGTWDFVNSSYDIDGDGNPDTGILLPGHSMNVTLAIRIPGGFKGNETAEVIVYSFLSQSIRDDARDDIHVVPELQNLMVPLLAVLGLILIKRKGKFTPCGVQSQ